MRCIAVLAFILALLHPAYASADPLDYSAWLKLSEAYKRGYLLGYLDGATLVLSDDSEAGKRWRWSLSKCVSSMTDQALVTAFDAFVKQDISRMTGRISYQVPRVLSQLCEGKLQ